MFGAKRRPKRTQKRDRKNDAEKRRKRSPKPAPKTNAQTSPKPRPRTPTQPAPPSPSQRTKPQPKPNPKNPGPRSRKRRRARPAQRAQKIGLKPPEEKRKSQRRARHSPQKRASPARRARAARKTRPKTKNTPFFHPKNDKTPIFKISASRRQKPRPETLTGHHRAPANRAAKKFSKKFSGARAAHAPETRHAANLREQERATAQKRNSDKIF